MGLFKLTKGFCTGSFVSNISLRSQGKHLFGETKRADITKISLLIDSLKQQHPGN